MLKMLLILGLLTFGSAGSLAQVVKELVGKYQMEVQDGDIMELRGDGSASMAGEETRWAARGNQLTVGPDVMTYSLAGGRLLVMFGPVQLAWKKIGGPAKGATPMEKAARGAQGQFQGQASNSGGDAQDAQARQTLMGSAWCSFTYSKVSGTTTTRRVVFRPDGIMSISGGRETYSSGYAGTYAGQSNTSGSMQWKLANQRLLIDAGDGSGFQDIGLKATRNSNGAIILHAEGREYSMCN
jgi:hypothetical protein